MQVRITAEVYPLEVCESIDTCQLDGESGHFDIKAQGRAPFDTWGVDKPQLRECFVDCKLPQPGLKLAMAHLRYMSSLAADGLKVAELAGSQRGRPCGHLPWGEGLCNLRRDADDELIHANMALEEIHTLGNGTAQKKAVGMCVGPVFSAAPTFLGEPRDLTPLCSSLMLRTALKRGSFNGRTHASAHSLACQCKCI